jgi:hypothetical protein
VDKECTHMRWPATFSDVSSVCATGARARAAFAAGANRSVIVVDACLTALRTVAGLIGAPNNAENASAVRPNGR